MSKFFDFCDKHKKAFVLAFLPYLVIILLLPIVRHWIFDADQALKNSTFIGYEIHGLISCIEKYQEYGARANVGGGITKYLFFTIFVTCSIVSYIIMLTRTFKHKKTFFAIPIAFLILAGFTASFNYVPNFEVVWEVPLFNATPMFVCSLVLLILYIIYHLLRRYYAPVKARILASRAERQANRKPTKDERIAELERKVAELESKNKDEQ